MTTTSPAHVSSIHESVLRPMLLCFSDCTLDKTRQSSVKKRLADIETAVQTGRAKLRPCLVLPNNHENATEYQKREICLMATFDDTPISQLPSMMRHFVTPVETGSLDWDIATFESDKRLGTNPQWKPKEGAKSQWVISYIYEVDEANLGCWRGGYHLNIEQQTRLLDICTSKRARWLERAENPAFRVKMLNSILEYAKNPRCEDTDLASFFFPSRITILEPGQSCASVASCATYQTYGSRRRPTGLRRQSTKFNISPIKENFSPTKENYPSSAVPKQLSRVGGARRCVDSTRSFVDITRGVGNIPLRA
ncbi:hypothetical protein BDP27DRAFT_1423944 [Rhodocollybia butyracea]|uniref:Uncharacterized protein n=1 Tax=Rhodocollybia butyracea TaxID=206335 RepID=A0A9P5PMY4_9AGAR|nr:hypothetical protein BDP27DRAFT_1423944 [Rhodocollybia butyracea]